MTENTAPSAAGRAKSVVGLTALVGRGARRLAIDAATGKRRSFPRTVGDLDARTLSTIIGRNVTSVAVLDGSVGTSSRARLALTGDDVPASVFVKMSAESAAIRMLGEFASLGENEVRFYQQLSKELTGVPLSYGAEFDSLTGRFVVVIEDLAAVPCEFSDTLHPIDKDKANLLVERLAHLHGTFWGRLPATGGGSGPLGWLIAPSNERNLPISGPIMRLSARRLADKTPIPIEDARFIMDNFPAVTQVLDRGPHTVLHGDSHPGNVYFRDGIAGMLDWQVVRRGHCSRDLAYSLVTGMAVEERRAHERELLDNYRQALVAAGGPDLDPDELWDRYRESVVQPLLASLSTAGLGGMQDEAIAFEGLSRAITALNDLDTVALLQKSL